MFLIDLNCMPGSGFTMRTAKSDSQQGNRPGSQLSPLMSWLAGRLHDVCRKGASLGLPINEATCPEINSGLIFAARSIIFVPPQ